MNKRKEVDFFLKDERGKLAQLVHEGVEQVNISVSNRGVHRGGHYHKDSIEMFYVISGSVEVTVHDLNGENVQVYVFQTDDFFCIEPGEVHSMYYPEDCVMVVLYDKWIEQSGDKDIHTWEK